MRFKQYLNEAMGRVKGKIGKITRSAHVKDDMITLKWSLKSTGDEEQSWLLIGDISYKELKDMQRKKVLDFYEDAYDISGFVGGPYEAEVKLFKYDPKGLMKELKRLKFKMR